MIPERFVSPPSALVTYSSTDIAANTGYINFYGWYDGTTYYLTPYNIPAMTTATHGTTVSTSLVQLINPTFQYTFAVPTIIQAGEAYLTATVQHQSGTLNRQTRIDFVLTLSGASSVTTLVSASGAQYQTTGSVPTPYSTARTSTIGRIGQRYDVAVGDVLKCEVRVYGSVSSGTSRAWYLYHDAADRAYISGASEVIDTAGTGYHFTSFNKNNLVLNLPILLDI